MKGFTRHFGPCSSGWPRVPVTAFRGSQDWATRRRPIGSSIRAGSVKRIAWLGTLRPRRTAQRRLRAVSGTARHHGIQLSTGRVSDARQDAHPYCRCLRRRYTGIYHRLRHPDAFAARCDPRGLAAGASPAHALPPAERSQSLEVANEPRFAWGGDRVGTPEVRAFAQFLKRATGITTVALPSPMARRALCSASPNARA